jgi:hypothetical protein
MRKLLLLLAFPLTAACATESLGSASDGGANVSCLKDARVAAWKNALTFNAGNGSVKLAFVSAEPAPPSRDTANVWQVKLTDQTGAALPDDTTVTLEPFMPDHGHGSISAPVCTAKGGGVWQVAPVNLFMPGVWRFTFTVQRTGVAPAQVVFHLCIPG